MIDTADPVRGNPRPAGAPPGGSPRTALRTTVERLALATALEAVAGAHTSRTTIPITGCVLIEQTADALVLRATDLQQDACYRLPVAGEPGACAVPLALLRGVVGALPDAQIALRSVGHTLHVAAGSNATQIKGRDPSEFPPAWTPDAEARASVTMAADRLRAILTRVGIAAARDDTRPVLGSVLVRVAAEALTVVAADGLRLACLTIPADDCAWSGAGDALVPFQALGLFDKALARCGDAPVDLALFEPVVRLDAGASTIVTRLVVGAFPNYEAILRCDATWTATANTQQLAAAIRAARLLATKADVVSVTATESGLRVAARSGELGEAQIDVAAEIDGAAGQFDAQGRFLADALTAIGAERARLSVASPTSPVLIEPVDGDAYRHVVMPMVVPR